MCVCVGGGGGGGSQARQWEKKSLNLINSHYNLLPSYQETYWESKIRWFGGCNKPTALPN